MRPAPRSALADVRVGITGGTTDVGRYLVDGLRRAGAELVIVGGDDEPVRRVVEAHAGVHGIPGDPSDDRETYRIALRATSALGGIDVLVHVGAGGSADPTPAERLIDTPPAALEEMWATRVVGPHGLTRALLPTLTASARRRRPALLVYVVEGTGPAAPAGRDLWGAGRAAILNLAHVWSEELRGVGIRVACVETGTDDAQGETLGRIVELIRVDPSAPHPTPRTSGRQPVPAAL